MAEATTGKGAKGDRASSRRRNRPSPRECLLASATTLLATEGIRVVGIDRTLQEADVAKASPYLLLGPKDKLVIAHLQDLDAKWREVWEQRVASLDTPAEKILAFFDQCIVEQLTIDFRGLRLQNTVSECPRPETESEQDIRRAAAGRRSWVWQRLHTLLTGNESSIPSTRANMLLLYPDGSLAGAKMSKDLNPLQIARDLARDPVT